MFFQKEGEESMSQDPKLILALVVVTVLGWGMPSAKADTLNFDSLAAMVGPVGTPVPASARLSNQLLNSGVRFSSGSDFVAVVGLGSGHATSGLNGIGGVNSAGQLSYFIPIRVTFFLPSDPSIQAVTDFVSIRGDMFPLMGTLTLQAFDLNGNLLGSVTEPDSIGTTLSLSVAGIHSIRLSQSSGTVAFDDLSFNPLAAAGPTTPVSEPTTMLLLGTGLAGIAGMIKQRRRQASKRRERV